MHTGSLSKNAGKSDGRLVRRAEKYEKTAKGEEK